MYNHRFATCWTIDLTTTRTTRNWIISMRPRNTRSTRNPNLCFLFVCLACFAGIPLASAPAAEAVRAMQFQAQTPGDARAWQATARAKLFALLMGGGQPERVLLEAKVMRSIEAPTNQCVPRQEART